jgi:hypothetical protein
MPGYEFYDNDALVIMSNTASCAEIVFLFYYMITVRPLKTWTKDMKDVDIKEFLEVLPFLQPLVGKYSLACAMFFNIAAFTFFMAGSLLNVTEYGQNGFTYGLLDNGKPSRQWYYVTGIIFVILNFFIFISYEVNVRREMYQRSGMGRGVVGAYDSVVDGTVRRMKKMTKAVVGG